MSDLINRRVAIKAIADLENCYNGFSDTYDKAYIIGVLEELPTVGAVPVIRCKDCKYSDTFSDMTAEPHSQLKCLGIRYGGVEPMWYCEHGERKEE